MRNSIAIYLSALICIIPQMSRAEDNVWSDSLGRDLAVKAIWSENSVKLRWATGNTAVWNIIKKNGITLTRHDAEIESLVILNDNRPIEILSDSGWKSLSEKIPSAAQVATLLSGNAKDLSGRSDYSLADLMQNKLTALLLLAEFDYQIARGLALGYSDATAEQGKIYRYQLILPDPDNADTIRVEYFISTENEESLQPITGLQGAQGDGFIDLWWTLQSFYSGYFIERKEYKESSWRRLNERPIIFADSYSKPYLYRDSVANYIRYEYRIIGTDVFGRNSDPSVAFEISARDLTPPQTPFDPGWTAVDSGAVIRWKNPPAEPDLAGYGLLKSENPDENYKPIHKSLLPPGTTSYFDTIKEPGTYFYRLIAADTAGNTSPMSVRTMVVINDTIPPAPPENLSVFTDSSGVIKISWNHRQENDAAGYRVYRMITGGNEAEYYPLTPGLIMDSLYTDTVLATARDIFTYYVISVDFAGNYSQPSQTIAARLPDKIPPSAPVIEDFSVSNGKISISFISASSDVSGYEIHRYKFKGEKPEQVISVNNNTWLDSTAIHNKEYIYEVLAIDSSGNYSAPSKQLYAKPFWPVEMNRPGAPQLSHNKSKKSVNIKWKLPSKDQCTAVVFRRSGEGQFLQLSPELNKGEFVDKDLKPGNYGYALKFYYPDQGETELGEEASIQITE